MRGSIPRYELKSWVDARLAARVVEELRDLLAPDPHGARPEDPSYTVTTLYLDTRDMRFYREKIEGQRKRKKVRLRRYDRHPGGLVEIKAKTGRRIRKHKLTLSGGALGALARGDLSPLRAARARKAGHDDDDVVVAARLLACYTLLNLVPSVITRYVRTAYTLREDPGVRLTFDRQLVGLGDDLVEAFLDPRADELPMLALPTQAAGILEVKCWGPVPGAVARVLRRAGIETKSISKYCLAVERARRCPSEGSLATTPPDILPRNTHA